MDVKEQKVSVFERKEEAGLAAGKAIESCILKLLKTKEEIRMIFAAAPSQNDTLAYLSNSAKIPWNRIIAFNMDEYIGLPKNSKQSFSTYLQENLFSKVDFKEVNLISPSRGEKEELVRISNKLEGQEIDAVVLGIGQNGHIAFNDPPVADFNDPLTIKAVQLDEVCKQQQVNDNCFSSIDLVPSRALTLTIPTIMRAKHLFCIVSGKNKAEAVKHTFAGKLTVEWPSSILPLHDSCSFFFDKDAYALMD